VSLDEVRAEIDAFVAAHRDAALWFVHEGFVPATDEARLRALTHIQRRGDRATFARAGELKRCLSPNSSAESAEPSPTSASPAGEKT
jgi:hypothetical protein